MKPGHKLALLAAAFTTLGIAMGGYLFADTQPRSFIAFHRCESCLRPADLAGLLASVGILKTPYLIPGIVMETDKTFVIRHPQPAAPIHYVLIPKKDIKDVADISTNDSEYLIDLFATVGALVRREGLVHYRVYSNGPGYQHVRYLHFHLIASRRRSPRLPIGAGNES